jgi:hypothetical protein
MPCGTTYEEQMEYVNKLCECLNEDEQWIREELYDLTGLNSVDYWQGVSLNVQGQKCGPKAVRKKENEKIRIIHNIFIEKGLESPFVEFSGFRKTKHNPDKKKGGKKKKGGRRRI